MSLIDKEIQRYLESHSESESPVLNELRRETYLQVLLPQMITDPVQGRLLANWSRLLKPRRILEVGTFTGYSCICLAEGLDPEGEVITIEVNAERATRIKRFLELAGIADRAKLVIGDAKEAIAEQQGPFDLVFLDADKANYPAYYDLVFPLIREDGWLIADNVLWQGKVTRKGKDKETLGLQRFNDLVAADPRVEVLMLQMRDGLSLIRKKNTAEISAKI
ncbi:MAG: O-methyltransferase [Bacteroidia bacterium]|nr:O-methyltransferase [Bacteroidia bacterium]